MLVQVFLNDNPRDSMFYGYREQDRVVLAASYETEETDHTTALEDAFRRFNIGDEEGDPIALEYRRNEHRSLSVGDVVVLTVRPDVRVAYACKRTGWGLLGSKVCELRTPDQWSELTGWLVLDPDGWRADGRAWSDPIGRDEFERRARRSTGTPPELRSPA